MVTLSTTSFKIQQLYVLPTECISVILWMSEQAASISLCGINRLLFVTKMECVYSVEQTKLQIDFNIIFIFKVWMLGWK